MVSDEHLAVRLDWWDDTVGAFEPGKVLRQVRRVFPDAEIDPTDHQEVRLKRELEFWSQGERAPELRDKLVRQSKELYRTNGPMYWFVVPIDSGHRVRGWARRLSVGFVLPPELPTVAREHLQTFLRSLKMGEPVLDHNVEDAEPNHVAASHTTDGLSSSAPSPG